MEVNMTDYYLTTTDVAKMFNTSRQNVLRWINNGRIKAERVGRSYKIEEGEAIRLRKLMNSTMGTKELGEILNVPQFDILYGIRKGEVRPVKIKKGYRIPQEEVNRLESILDRTKTIKETSSIAGVNEKTLTRWIVDGKVEATKFNNKYRIPICEVNRLWAQNN